MTNFYGVDSTDPAQQVQPYLHGKWGCYSSFHMRYIGANYATDAAEIAFLLGLGIRVGFVFNLRAGTEFPLHGYAAGHADGVIALGILGMLCPGKKPAVFRDVESGQPIDADYMRGWCAALAERQWPGGFYGPGSQLYFASTYALLVGTVDRRYRFIWNARWIGYHAPAQQPAWAPAVCPGIPESDVAFWQFAGDVPELNTLVDCNLGTQEGYDLLLGASVPAPKALVWHALHTSALKPPPVASHATPSIHTVLGGDVVVPSGKTQTAINPKTLANEEWWEVTTTVHGATFTGFLLKANLYHD